MQGHHIIKKDKHLQDSKPATIVTAVGLLILPMTGVPVRVIPSWYRHLATELQALVQDVVRQYRRQHHILDMAPPRTQIVIVIPSRGSHDEQVLLTARNYFCSWNTSSLSVTVTSSTTAYKEFCEPEALVG